jgi:hypothetical protein
VKRRSPKVVYAVGALGAVPLTILISVKLWQSAGTKDVPHPPAKKTARPAVLQRFPWIAAVAKVPLH